MNWNYKIKRKEKDNIPKDDFRNNDWMELVLVSNDLGFVSKHAIIGEEKIVAKKLYSHLGEGVW